MGGPARKSLAKARRTVFSAFSEGTIAQLLQSHILWLGLSLGVSVFYASLGLAEGFRGEYVIQEDARQHVFWMQRFVDPSFFPHDLIADFFQSVAPVGYKGLYRTAIATGLDPFVFNKFLPPIILIATTVYAYFLALEVIPLAAMGGLAAILLNQVMWITNDVASGTPRAFVYLLLSAYFYYALKRSLWPYLATIVLQSLFYPHTVLIGAAFSMVRLISWDGKHLRPVNRQDAKFYLLGIGMAIAVMLPYVFQTSVYGPTVTAAEARQMPEFSRGGRTPFFGDDELEVWFEDSRVGLLPHHQYLPQVFQLVVLFPILLLFPRLSPLIRQHRSKTVLLGQILLGSLSLFVLAHLLLFRLHLPARYCEFTIRMVMALAVAFVLTVLLDTIVRWSMGHTVGRSRWRMAVAAGACSLLVGLLIYLPTTVGSFIKTGYREGSTPELYEFFADRPVDITIAALTPIADDIPAFSDRTVLYSPEYGIPYQLGYYKQLRERAIDLLRSQYSPSLAEIDRTIRQYGIDYWLIEPDSLTLNFLERNQWLHQFRPTSTEVMKQLERGEIPAMTALVETCSVFQSQEAVVLSATCLADAEPQPSV